MWERRQSTPRRYLAPFGLGRKHSASCAIVALYVAFSSPAAGAIDFTPLSGERMLEGIVFKELIFHEKGRQIAYTQPKGWSYTGNSSGLRLTPPEANLAHAEIEQSPLPAPQPLDEATVKLLRDVALKSVPPGSLQVAVVGEERDPVRINDHSTYGITLSYEAYGQEFMANILFANLDDTQLRFRVVARKDDFEKVSRAFRGSLFSFYWK